MAFHSYIIFSSLMLLLFPLNISCQNTYTKISPGMSISASTNFSVISPSEDFAFGFRALENDPTRFLLAVYYQKIRGKTVIWTANRDNPVTNQSITQLTLDGQLTLQEPSNQQIWSANIIGASHGYMYDNGTFILFKGSSVIWQTFDFPTDTLLPGQILNQSGTIYAKLTDDDYSRGRFKLTLQIDHNLVGDALPLGYPTTTENNPFDALDTYNQENNQLVFNKTGSIYILFNNGSTVLVLPERVLTGDNYLRATLDPDGNFRQYYFPKAQPSTGRWSIAANLIKDICNMTFSYGSGTCGFNSYCTLYGNGFSKCQCPPHYTFIDPTQKHKGCKPDFDPQVCEQGSGSFFAFEKMKNLDWPISHADMINGVNETQCQDECLDDCFCSVAIYFSGKCWTKKYPLSNGISNGAVDRLAFIKYNKLNTSMVEYVSSNKLSNWKRLMIVASSILTGSMVLNVLLIGARFHMHKKRKPERNSLKISMRSFTYKELEEATRGFRDELGKGAFGVLYKGVLPSQFSNILIAVKKLKESLLEEAEKDFENEVATIGRTHHKNLVRLLGFCEEGSHRLLVFEFLSNGSLNKFIFGSDRLNWNQRVQIVLDIANGLSYLHEECRTQIIHCDIKPQNILLNENMEAKISDFGLAKLLRLDQTKTSTGIRGTIGYFAPEWFKNVAVTAKIDVYSFGVMLLQIIFCRKSFEWGLESHETTAVIDWAKKCYENGRLDLLVEDDKEAKRDGIRLERFVMVGVSCVEDLPWLRPSMKKVVQMLEGAIETTIQHNMHHAP